MKSQNEEKLELVEAVEILLADLDRCKSMELDFSSYFERYEATDMEYILFDNFKAATTIAVGLKTVLTMTLNQLGQNND